MAEFIKVDELTKKILENHYSIKDSQDFVDFGMTDLDIYQTIGQCKFYEFEESKAEWDKQHEHIILASGDIKEWDNYFCNNCNNPSSYPYDYCPYCGCEMEGCEEVDEQY